MLPVQKRSPVFLGLRLPKRRVAGLGKEQVTLRSQRPFADQLGDGVCNSPASPYPAHPAELVGNLAALDADQLRLDGGRYRAGRTVGDQYVPRSALDLADRSDDGGRAAGECFLQPAAPGVRAPLVHRIAFLDRKSVV